MEKEYLIHNIEYTDNPEDQHQTIDITISDLEVAGQDITATIGIDMFVNGMPTSSNKYEDVSLTGAGGSGGTGDLISVTVSPSISAERELSSFFPINYDSLTPEEKVDGKEIYLVPDQALSEGDEYSYTITPGADWYVNKGGGNFGGQGEAVTLTATVELSDGKPILEIPVSIRNEPTFAADKILTVSIIYDNLI